MDSGCVEIRTGIRGPNGRAGFLIRAPASHELDWDIENEIGSLSRQRLGSGSEWWIAESYRLTMQDILSRLSLPVLLDHHG